MFKFLLGFDYLNLIRGRIWSSKRTRKISVISLKLQKDKYNKTKKWNINLF